MFFLYFAGLQNKKDVMYLDICNITFACVTYNNPAGPYKECISDLCMSTKTQPYAMDTKFGMPQYTL